MRLLIVIIFGVFSSMSASGQYKFTDISDCTPVRLDEGSGPLTKLPVYDQDNLNSCGAFAASNLVNAYFAKKRPEMSVAVSPTHLSFSFANHRRNKRTLEIGESLEVAQMATKIDLCDYKAFADGPAFTQGVNKLFDGYKKRDVKVMEEALQKMSLGQLSIGLEEVLRASGDFVDFIDTIARTACADAIIVKSGSLPAIRTVWRGTDAKTGSVRIRDAINTQLNLSQPIAINYCLAVHFDPKVNGISRDGYVTEACRGKNYKPGDWLLGHAAAIVGRRILPWGDGKSICQFLVRTNYIYCDANNHKDFECLRGQIWIDEDALVENTAHAFYLPFDTNSLLPSK